MGPGECRRRASMSPVAEPPARATRSFSNKHKALYASERDCTRYDAMLCRRQDYRGALLAAIDRVLPLHAGMTVVDVGTGTGKLARMVSGRVGRVSAYDRSAEMIAVARADGPSNVEWGVADVRAVPLPDGCADLVLAGWALSYLKAEHEEWYADGSSGGPWREELDRAVAELDRLLAPGGALVVLET